MRHTKGIAGLAVAMGMLFGGGLKLQAQDWRGAYPDRPDVREDYRDMRRDSRAIERLRADIARDRWRLDEDIRRGHEGAARRHAADLARDQRRLEYLLRDLHQDRRDARRDQRGYYGDGYRDSNRDWR